LLADFFGWHAGAAKVGAANVLLLLLPRAWPQNIATQGITAEVILVAGNVDGWADAFVVDVGKGDDGRNDDDDGLLANPGGGFIKSKHRVKERFDACLKKLSMK
jgi:hypothetical protein